MNSKEKIKIFTTAWHLAHQYDLYTALEDYCEFYLVENSVRHWTTAIRPIPKNAHFVKYYEEGKYDLALLHIDQQCVHPKIGKGNLYRDLNEIIKDIPKIVINHGTPMIPEYGLDEDVVINGGIMQRDNGKTLPVAGMKKLIGNNFMVVNSYRAAERWGWGYPIWHGKDNEYFDLPKELRAVTMVSAGGMDKYYNRVYLSTIKELLRNDYGIRLWQITVDWRFDMDVDNENGYDAYRDFLGRSLLYIHIGKDSPMPRARAEAMLSGCCIITTDNHDESKFIEHGVNGFIIPDNAPQTVARLIATFLHSKTDPENPDKSYYDELIAIGQRGKKTAQEVFSKERYRDDWLKVINTVLEKGTKEAGKELYGRQDYPKEKERS